MPRDLDLTFDISTGALTLDRVVGNYVKRSETLTLSVTIVSNGASATIPSGLVGTLKPVNTYGTTLAQWTTFAQVGATNVYTASTTINAAAVTTLLGTTTEQANCVFDFAGAGVVESDTLALVLKNNVTRDDDTAPTALLNRNDFLVTNGTGLLVNVAAGYAANGAFVAAQASLAITNATNYIEVTAAGVASVNTTAFTAGSYPLATVVASAGAITSNTDLRAWITPKPAAGGGVTSITGTANEITVTGTTTPTLSLPSALTFTGKTITGGTFASPTLTTPTIGDGTESAPSLSFASDTDTGVYRPAADTVGIVGGGHDILRLTDVASATDYLEIKNGIGVGSPLHVLAEGASTNIGMHLQPKGSGLLTISDGTDFNKGIRFRCSSSAASAITLLDAVSSAGRVVTLPDATGTLALVSGDLGTPTALVGTNITGTASGLTAGNATLAATVTVANEATDTTCFPLFATAATGSLGVKTNAGFTYNSAAGAEQIKVYGSVKALGGYNVRNDLDTIGFDISGYNTAVQLTAGMPYIRVGGGASESLFLNAGLTGGYVAITKDLGDGILLGDGTGGNSTYLKTPATGTLRVTTNGSTLGTVDAATFTGNAATATKWTTGRTIALTGDVTYTSGAFDGSGNVTGVATLAATSNTSLTSLANLVTVGTLTGGATGAGFTVALGTSTLTGRIGSANNTLANADTTSMTAVTTLGAAGVVTNMPGTTAAASATTGALTIGNGTAATNVGIGGGNINAGGTLKLGGAITLNGNFNVQTITDASYDRLWFGGNRASKPVIVSFSANTPSQGTQFEIFSVGDVANLTNFEIGRIAMGNPNSQFGSVDFTLDTIKNGSGTLRGIRLRAGGVQGLYNGPTGGINIGGTTDPGANNLSVAGTASITGNTTITGNLTSNGALISTPQALTGAGAVNVTTLTTAVTTTAPAQALTLANGTNGQIKTIVHQALSGGGTWVLTPTTKTGYTTITSTAVGETCTLQFFTTIGWCILSLRGAIAA